MPKIIPVLHFFDLAKTIEFGKSDWNAAEMEVIDPVGNYLVFFQSLQNEKSNHPYHSRQNH